MLRFRTKITELYVVTWMTKKVTMCVGNTGGGWVSSLGRRPKNERFFGDFSNNHLPLALHHLAQLYTFQILTACKQELT